MFVRSKLNTRFIWKYIFIPLLLTLILSTYFHLSANIAKFGSIALYIWSFTFLLFFPQIKISKKYLFRIYFIIISLSSIVINFGIPPGEKSILSISTFNLLILLFFIKVLLSKNLFKYTETKHLPKFVRYSLLLILLSGLITVFLTNTKTQSWINACVLPFVILYICFYIVNNDDNAKSLIIAANISVLGFLFITYFAFLTGNAHYIYRGIQTDQLSADVTMGAINYLFYPTMLGVLLSMIIPSSVMLYLNARKGKFKNIMLIIIFIYLSFAISIASRGATIAIIVSFILVIILYYKCIKKSNKFSVILSLIFIAIIIQFSFWIFSKSLNDFTYDRFSTMINDKFQTKNLQYRISLINSAIEDNGVFGIGFNILWEKYRTDEANLYSWLTNGIGLLGITVFILFIMYLMLQFLRALFSQNIQGKVYIIIGITTLVGVLLSSMSDNAIMFAPNYSIPFWTIIGATLKLTYLKSKRCDEE